MAELCMQVLLLIKVELCCCVEALCVKLRVRDNGSEIVLLKNYERSVEMAWRRSDLQELFPHRKINNAFFPSKPDKVQLDRASKKQLDIIPSTYENASLSTATIGVDSVQPLSLISNGFPGDHAYEDIDEVEMILRQFDMNLA
eukprot:Gb_09500 [translate_table: standard]